MANEAVLNIIQYHYYCIAFNGREQEKHHGIILAWDYTSKVPMETHYGGLTSVCSLVKVTVNKFASGSGDGSIRIWNYKKDECLQRLDNSGCVCLRLSSRRFLSY